MGLPGSGIWNLNKVLLIGKLLYRRFRKNNALLTLFRERRIREANLH